MMNYKEILPCPQLARHVRYFWILENDVSDGVARTFRVFSDGCPGLIFQQTGDVAGKLGTCFSHSLFLYGQSTRHTEQVTTGKFRTIGVYFYPDALKSIFGIDASLLTDKDTDLASVISRTDGDIEEQLLNASSEAKQIEILSDLFIRKMVSNKTPRAANLQFGLEYIASNKGGLSLKEVQSQLCVTERTLERMFRESIGISPKLFLRITRFQCALNLIRTGSFSSFSEVAHNSDYADQSHFIRDFKAFSGIVPQLFPTCCKETVANFPELIN
jgi:AraC-like DNA-binding protein